MLVARYSLLDTRRCRSFGGGPGAARRRVRAGSDAGDVDELRLRGWLGLPSRLPVGRVPVSLL